MKEYTTRRFLHLFMITLGLSEAITLQQLDCVDLTEHIISAYYNWPYSLDCDRLLSNIGINATSIQSCDVFDVNGTNVEGQLLTIDKRDDEMNLTYSVVMNTTTPDCFTTKYIVTLSDLPNAQCDTATATAHKDGSIQRVAIIMNSRTLLQCHDPSKPPPIPKGADPNDFITQWKRNCYSDMPGCHFEHYRTIERYGYPDDLKMVKINFDRIGNYTCFLKHKNETLVAATYNICVKDRLHKTAGIRCTNTTVVAKGKTANISCTGRLPRGIIPTGSMRIYFKNSDKNSDTGEALCSVDEFGRVNNTNNGKYSCLIDGVNINKTMPCEDGSYRGDLSDKLSRDRNDGNINFNVLIRNVGNNDFASFYTVTLQYDDIIATSQTNVSLKRDWGPYYKYLRDVVLAPCLVILVLLLIVSLALWYYRLELRYIMKKFFLSHGCFHPVDKKHDFFFLYEGDPTNVDFMKIFSWIEDAAKAKGYQHFDEQQDIDSAGKVRIEVITNKIRECPYLVVIVTSELIENNWAKFHLQVCISKITPIKFIFFPGTKHKLRKTKGWKKIAKVIKVCDVLEWTETTRNEDVKKFLNFGRVGSKTIQQQHEQEENKV